MPGVIPLPGLADRRRGEVCRIGTGLRWGSRK